MMPLRLDPAPNAGDFLQTFSFRLDDNTLPDLAALDTLDASIMSACGHQVWTGSRLGGELVVTGPGEVAMTIPEDKFSLFIPGTYRGAIRATEGTATEVLALFDLPVISGNFP